MYKFKKKEKKNLLYVKQEGFKKKDNYLKKLD